MKKIQCINYPIDNKLRIGCDFFKLNYSQKNISGYFLKNLAFSSNKQLVK